MCSPAVIPVAAGALVGVVGSVVRGQAESAQAAVNAKLAARQRSAALQQGVSQASAIGAQARQIQSSALAGLGASGVDTTSGTAGNVLAITAANAAADMEQAKANAALRAWGFENEEQDWYRRARVARTEMGFGIAGSILGGVGGTASALTSKKT